ncbi:extracellular solute-binding protein [Winogradskya humida]|uniref:Sugar ABC transporter substrate-binding protein n=1 Tax=Winogradskya humida TaxID=113566 RepID=A0ABQ3ZEF3_9ACTN|nr:extracellular solute-binding protein [Actinoplanes humidus]GIE16904.1 sugar ABC transporter substrate-binding protein [Actinoplanes humidus]
MVSRRALLRAGAAVSLAGLGAACSGEPAGSKAVSALWCWPGGLSEKVVADAVTTYASRTDLRPAIFTGDYLSQMWPPLEKGSGVPAIAGIKGEDIASLLPRADRFVDLNSLGAQDLAGTYLPWKMQQGSTIDGQQIGLPIDIGPTAMFYRSDIFGRAGLPTEPDAVTALMPTWEKYLDAGEKLHKALPGVHWLRNGAEIFSTAIGQARQRFVDESNHFIGDQQHVRDAWKIAVELIERGLSAGISPDEHEAWAAALTAGKLATETGAAWHSADIEEDAPAQIGLWRVAAGPAAGANTGGSFLAIPAAGAGHELSFEIIKWLLSVDNQARNFTDAALFPAAPAAYTMSALTEPDTYFGGQVTVGVFGASAEKLQRAYEAPSDAGIEKLYLKELDVVEKGGRTGDQGWSAAVTAARTYAVSQGVN